MGILDTIIDTKHNDLLHNFEPAAVVGKLLGQLKERERKILSARFGLNAVQVQTLEEVGKDQGLTRERVRQIEKALLKQLKQTTSSDESLLETRMLFVSLIDEHGGIMAEEVMLEQLRYHGTPDANSIIFILNLISEVQKYDGSDHVKPSWITHSFDPAKLHTFIAHAKELLTNHSKPLSEEDLLEKVSTEESWKHISDEFNPKIVLNYLKTAKEIKKNVFGHFGIANWNEIQPKDVGDKAYLVLKHHGKPEHYSGITELINKHKFDSRTAYKETVHNELIKDKRFTLVGRGIYALLEWGYKPGVVSDVIREVLQEKGEPMTRDEIIQAVLGRRMVKKNTVLVGLSNKKLFKKTGKNLYSLMSVE